LNAISRPDPVHRARAHDPCDGLTFQVNLPMMI
jgi:hypothetical protein